MSTRFVELMAFLVVPLMALSVTADVVPRARASAQMRPEREGAFPERWPGVPGGAPAGHEEPTSLVRRRTDVRLLRTLEASTRRGEEAGRREMERQGFISDDEDRILVMIHEAAVPSYRPEGPAIDPAEERLFEAMARPIVERIEAVSGELAGRVLNIVEAWVPVEGVPAIATAPGISWIAPTPPPMLAEVVGQGVEVIHADELQAIPPFRPREEPVRVGVLDQGFLGYRELLGTELPDSVETRSFHADGIEAGGEHGAAVAEVVHDVAPGAELFLTNYQGLAGWKGAIEWLIDQEVDVINASVGQPSTGPGTGVGPFNAYVQLAVEDGIEFVLATGNQARLHWMGEFTDKNGNGLHEWAEGDEENGAFVPPGATLTLFLDWNDWFRSDQDFDMRVLVFRADDGSFLGSVVSDNRQTGSQLPREAIHFVNDFPFTVLLEIQVRRQRAPDGVVLRLFALGGGRYQWFTPEGSISIPADTPGAIAVGATHWATDEIEEFSGRGPTVDGRTKPDLVAPDGVANVTIDPFFGTSAAAPTVTGAIALMKSRFDVFTTDEIVEILYGRAEELGPRGKDNVYGFGRLDLKGR